MKTLKYLIFVSFSINLFAASGQINSQVSLSNPAMQAMKFLGTSSKNYMFLSMNAKKADYSFTGSANGQGGFVSDSRKNIIPEFEYAKKNSDNLIFTIKYSTPVLLNTGYTDTGDFNNFASERGVRINDLSPEIAYMVNSKLTVGAGLDILKSKIKIDNIITANGFTKAKFKNDLNSSNVGYHVGLLFTQPWVGAFVGVSYYSPVSFDLNGYSSINDGTPNKISSALKLPYNFKAELLQALSPSKILFLNWQHTNWSSIDTITLLGTPLGPVNETLGYVATSKTSFGTIIKNKDYRIIGGFAYDISPAKGSFRTANNLEPENFWTGGLDVSKIIDGYRVGASYGRLLNHRNHAINSAQYTGKIAINSDSFKIYIDKRF